MWLNENYINTQQAQHNPRHSNEHNESLTTGPTGPIKRDGRKGHLHQALIIAQRAGKLSLSGLKGQSLADILNTIDKKWERKSG